ncbi:MAG: serine hydrolase [Clostridia bacterium]|nr:serine hydrolase [Clostridia bacterium]
MFEKITPEQAGFSAESVIEFINKAQKRGASTHGILMMKGDKIFAEAYWKPFHQDFCHRMYSQTKSFVGIAIGLLQEEGKLSIHDKIVDYFPEKINGELAKYLKDQTIKDMLTMSTIGNPADYWFTSKYDDRTQLYLNDDRNGAPHASGTIWQYDSSGSQVLSALVEKLSGKSLLDYMKEKLFNEMGTFQTATVLKCRNGDSWGDSAMVCTLRDIASFGRLLMQKGVWNGKRLMNEEYIREATSKVVDNKMDAHYCAYHQGYGYQIWTVANGGFMFNGMGDQVTLCYPEQDLLFTFNSDNQGTNLVRQAFVVNFEDMFVEKAQNTPLPENKAANEKLAKLIDGLKLRAVQGEEDSAFRQELDGQEYICDENPMGITKFSFHFTDKTKGELRYTKASGEKVLPFGVNYNEFGKFPEYGYSNDFGGVRTTDGFLYDDAVSFVWLEEKKLLVYAQVIDRYFGNVSMIFAFKGDYATAKFTKAAEDFMWDYNGVMSARKAKK